MITTEVAFARSTWRKSKEFSAGLHDLAQRMPMELVRLYVTEGVRTPRVRIDYYDRIDELRALRREALLAEREAQLEKEQAEFAAAKERGEEGKKSFLNNNDPNFVNPKEKLYDKFPLTVHQMDIIIGVLFALIVLFLVLGMTHTSFFGLFGG